MTSYLLKSFYNLLSMELHELISIAELTLFLY